MTMIDWHKILLEHKVTWTYPGYGPHAIFSLNNNHSDFYINSDYLAHNQSLIREISRSLFNIVNKKMTINPDWVLTYPPFGLHIGLCLAELFNCKFGYIQSVQKPEIHLDLKVDETALLCADDIISGTSIKKVINAASNKGAKVLDTIAVIANLSGKQTFTDRLIISLIEQEVNIWEPADCLLCASGSPALPARENWLQLAR